MKLKRIFLSTLMLISAGLALCLWVYNSQLIQIRKIEDNGKINTVFIGEKAHHDNFEEASRHAEASAKPFREAGELMEAEKYDEALKALDESLQKSTYSIEKSMVYDRMHEIYQKTGNFQKELEAIELWFKEAGEKANSPRLEKRAEEIRRILKQKNAGGVKRSGKGTVPDRGTG